MKKFALPIIIVCLLLSSCRYGRPLISWKAEPRREYQGDTISYEYIYLKASLRHIMSDGYITKYYYDNGQLSYVGKFRASPREGHGYKKIKSKEKYCDSDGNLIIKQVYLGRNLDRIGRYVEPRIDKTIIYKYGKREVINNKDTIR
ncbi:MAG: hypothetical protein JXR53_03075 [Bacteroidales bacterium]|nr:hypothetical protein [Bacteroidales bacterium]